MKIVLKFALFLLISNPVAHAATFNSNGVK